MSALVPSSMVALLLAGATPAFAAAPEPFATAVAPASAPEPAGLLKLGLLADAGLPDGMNAALVFRPWSWLRVQGGVGSNTMSTGYRAGLTLLPFGWGPSLSVEAGRYKKGDANAFAQRFVGSSYEDQAFLERVGYDYVNGHLGLDFGSRRFVFFLHGGVTSVRATLSDDGQGSTVISKSSGDDGSETEVSVSGESKLKAFGPSFKVGLILFFI